MLFVKFVHGVVEESHRREPAFSLRGSRNRELKI